MKRVLFSLAIICITFALSAQNQQDNEQNKPINLNVELFKQRVLNYQPGNNEWNYLGDKPCLIDFWAAWCGPCRMLGPHIDEMAEKFAGQVYIYKIDTTKERELAALFQVSSIPSLLFIPVGGQPIMLRGYRNAQQLESEIRQYLLQK